VDAVVPAEELMSRALALVEAAAGAAPAHVAAIKAMVR
jgi:enoyl-CoA hydratase/carnithine racemase